MKAIFKIALLIICLCQIVEFGAGERILFVAGTGSKSHIYFFEGIIQSLIANGHKVTFISHYKTSLETNFLNHVILPKNVKNAIVPNAFESNNYRMMISFLQFTPESCVLGALKDPGVQEALEDHYDLLMISTFYADCFLAVAHQKQIPFVYVSYNALMGPYGDKFGNPDFPSISPHKLLPFVHPLSFPERVLTTVGHMIWNFVINRFLLDRMEQLCFEHELCSEDTPSFREIGKSSNLIIVNSVFALESPIRPVIPSVIYAGGIHIQPIKPLPKDLEDWMEDSGEAGVIYFSLGSAVQSTMMKNEHLTCFIKVFGALKQNVLWKWDSEDIQNLPQNVRIAKWLPQQDILAHRRTRLFITHGGLLSLQEATHFGVPILGMPVLGDQMNNVAEAASQGWAKSLGWDRLTELTLQKALQELLNDESALMTVRERSRIMKDLPTSSAQSVSFWIDYVIRHKGARHFQSPFLKMTWYQVYNVDVWAFLAFSSFLLAAISIVVLKRILQMVLRIFKEKKD